MTATTRSFGIVLILLGIASYTGTGRTSTTALIPAFFGAALVVLALVARREPWRPHAMHAAVALAVLGLIGTLMRAVPALANGQWSRPAVLAQLATALVLAAYIAMGVRSFVEARRARAARQ